MKTIWVLLAATAVAGTLTACGGAAEAEVPAAPVPTVTVTATPTPEPEPTPEPTTEPSMSTTTKVLTDYWATASAEDRSGSCAAFDATPDAFMEGLVTGSQENGLTLEPIDILIFMYSNCP